MPRQKLPRWATRAATVAAVFAVGFAVSSGPTPAAAPTGLGQLRVSGYAAAGYDRDEFGGGWADLDGDRCRTRDEVLERDLTRTKRAGCKVLAGHFTDSYTGQVYDGVTAHLDIDHRVALADAWRSGAARWTDRERQVFANDPANLITTFATVNRAKSDKGPDQWMPPTTAGACDYAREYVEVKAAYRLTVTHAQYHALRATLAGCE